MPSSLSYKGEGDVQGLRVAKQQAQMQTCVLPPKPRPPLHQGFPSIHHSPSANWQMLWRIELSAFSPAETLKPAANYLEP